MLSAGNKLWLKYVEQQAGGLKVVGKVGGDRGRNFVKGESGSEKETEGKA